MRTRLNERLRDCVPVLAGQRHQRADTCTTLQVTDASCGNCFNPPPLQKQFRSKDSEIFERTRQRGSESLFVLRRLRRLCVLSEDKLVCPKKRLLHSQVQPEDSASRDKTSHPLWHCLRFETRTNQHKNSIHGTCEAQASLEDRSRSKYHHSSSALPLPSCHLIGEQRVQVSWTPRLRPWIL